MRVGSFIEHTMLGCDGSGSGYAGTAPNAIVDVGYDRFMQPEFPERSQCRLQNQGVGCMTFCGMR